MRLPWHPVRPDTPSAAHPPAADDAGPATRGLGDGPPAGDERRGNTAAVAAYGRLLTGARASEDLTAEPTGAVHVCGIGLIPSP